MRQATAEQEFGPSPATRCRQVLWAGTLAVILGQLVLAAVAAAPAPTSAPSGRLAQLTPFGERIYRPERELQFYVAGFVVSMLLCGAVFRFLTRPAELATPGGGVAPAAFVCAVGSLIAAGLLVGLHRTELAAKGLLPLVFCIGPLATLVFTAAVYLSQARSGHSGWTAARGAFVSRFFSTVVVPCGICAALYVPDIVSILKTHHVVLIHHWDFFAFSPMWSYLSGKPLVISAYSQYGVGWPLLFALFSTVTPVDYLFALRMAMVVDGLYFCSLYFLVRHWLRSTTAAVCCVVLAIGLQIHCTEVCGPHLAFPSSTVMRYCGDVFLFWICLAHFRSRRRGWLWAMGAVVGAQFLLILDSGVWLNAALMVYLVLVCLEEGDFRGRWKSALGMAARAGCAEALFVAAGYLVATRGQLLSLSGIAECIAALRMYAGGFSAVPISDLPGWGLAAIVLAICTYLFAFASGVASACARRSSATSAVAAVVGTYGAGILCHAINRSIWENLFHVAVPMVILMTVYACESGLWVWSTLCRIAGGASAARGFGPARLALLVWFCVCISLACGAASYPGVARSAYQRWRHVPALSETDERLWEETVQRKNSLCALANEHVRRGERVAIIADVETWSMSESHLPAVFQFTPCSCLLLSQDLVARAVQDLESAGVDVVVVHDGIVPEGGPPEATGVVRSDSHRFAGSKVEPILSALGQCGFESRRVGHGLLVLTRHAAAIARQPDGPAFGASQDVPEVPRK